MKMRVVSRYRTAVRMFLAGTAVIGFSSGAVPAFATPTVAPPRVVPEKCRFSVPGSNLVCGQLNVKLDRSDSASAARIDLSYVIVKTRSASPVNNPVVFLTGGPGTSAIVALSQLANSSLGRSRDIIVIEQRGNGYSEPNLLCSTEDAAPPNPLRLIINRQCFEEVRARNIPLPAYNLAEASRDLVDLRTALKIKEWNIFGVSYGTFWALEYLRLKPEGVRSVILDSPYPPQADPRDQGTAALNGISAVLTACARNTQCNRTYPNLRQRFIRLVTSPLNEPVGFATAAERFAAITGVANQTAVAAFMPRFIRALERNDQNLIAAITQVNAPALPLGVDPALTNSPGLALNSPCVEDVPFVSAPENRVRLSANWPTQILELIKPFNTGGGDFCNGVWEVERGSDQFIQPVTSDVPVLILAGAFDTITPPFYGEIAQHTLSRSTLAVLPDSSHIVSESFSACSMQIVRNFLRTPEYRPSTACLVRDQPRFSLPGDPIIALKAGR